MKKLHTFSLAEQLLAGMYKELLAQEGIACLLRNEQLSTALGEIPFTECFPELWVLDAETYPRAKNLLDRWLSVSGDLADWRCFSCGEESLGHFNACWACGAEREASDD